MATKLSEADWKKILPGEPHMIGETELFISPVGASLLKVILGKAQESFVRLHQLGITEANFDEPKNILLIAKEFIDHMPEVIADCAGLDRDDFGKLPLPEMLRLTTTVVKVNIESKQSMEDDLSELGKYLADMKNALPEPTPPKHVPKKQHRRK
ncbi:MAG: hypothetical protein GWN00_22965 [Aliifodinibius sp.]|nr:hypothetical protein [candidate division Zixibacteria bacterium]NIT58979.1 hypothetical protein [Fodinibius sp.]NIX01216.1 hypothetical protein [Phycisphaerae bacterium]NIR65533.1 hypothetical protein [candidate division Zixibacteria bacterium]NIS47219.1 hypothetical protein [candidate division Zixibacteria bacterium]